MYIERNPRATTTVLETIQDGSNTTSTAPQATALATTTSTVAQVLGGRDNQAIPSQVYSACSCLNITAKTVETRPIAHGVSALLQSQIDA